MTLRITYNKKAYLHDCIQEYSNVYKTYTCKNRLLVIYGTDKKYMRSIKLNRISERMITE